MINHTNFYLAKKNKCFCTCYLYETHEDFLRNLYINKKKDKCNLNKALVESSINNPNYIWITILSPFLNEWFLDAFLHSLIIRRLAKMQHNYKLTTRFEDLLNFYNVLIEETLLYKTRFTLITNNEKLIELNIKKFYEDSWSIFSLNLSLNAINLKFFYKNINPLLYYNLTSAYEITSCLQKDMKSAYILIPILNLFQEEFIRWVTSQKNTIKIFK